nr:hypothetical protein OG461_32100 [Streptomyces sp. NBC_00995]
MISKGGVDSEGAAGNPYRIPSVPEPAKDALACDCAINGGWASDLGDKVKVRRHGEAVVLEFEGFSDGSEGAPEHVDSLIFTLTRPDGSA